MVNQKKKKVQKLISEFEENIGHDRKNWRDMIHDFIFWLYEGKEYMIVPQKGGRPTLPYKFW